jgi:phosphoribosylformylglycinamidine cyclo-ligase
LLTPTRIYVKPVLDLLSAGMDIHAIGHITGGGFYDNIERLLPPTLDALVAINSWKPHPIFGLIMREGEVALEEMYRTFNMGMGMVLVVPAEEVDSIAKLLAQHKINPIVIGELRQGSGRTRLVEV